jgi:hypothetical protein
MVIKVGCVLRSGGDFGANDVLALAAGLQQYAPGVLLHCISDVPIIPQTFTTLPPPPVVNLFVIGMAYDWPGWWAKMEMFRPEITGDFLYFDLDTVLVGDISDLISIGKLTLLEDFTVANKLASGVMFIPEPYRLPIWQEWIADPDGIMARCDGFDTAGLRGDGKFLDENWNGTAAMWQRELPGQIVSYKVNVRNRGVPTDARVVCFHGTPRPWQVPPLTVTA